MLESQDFYHDKDIVSQNTNYKFLYIISICKFVVV